MSDDDRSWVLLLDKIENIEEGVKHNSEQLERVREKQETFAVAYAKLEADHKAVKRDARSIAMRIGTFFAAVGAAVVSGFIHWLEAWRG